MKRIREILLHEYIGAVTIGFLLAQAIAGIISVILQPIITYFENRRRPESIFAAHSNFNWPSLIVNVTSIILHLLAAFLLIYWLYLKKGPETVVVTEAPAAAADNSEGTHE